jgi:pyruvate dehydrogenase E1 component alpha subunit
LNDQFLRKCQKKTNFYGGHGIVGAQVPLGTGLSFAQKYLKEKDAITITYMGDGAANQGQVYESFNMASLWNLPIIYVIENNQYAMGTSIHRSSKKGDFVKRGEPWGIKGEKINGMDVLEVYKAGHKARQNILKGEGPQLLVMETYRYRGHSMSDPGNYRNKEEIDNIKQNQDPINQFKKAIINKYSIKEENIKKIEQDIKILMKDVIKFAEESKEPDDNELMTDIIK